MRLSEAILLGSTQLPLNPSVWLCSDGGCLIGMGLVAVGLTSADFLGAGDAEEIITPKFPWLKESLPIPQIITERLIYDGAFSELKHLSKLSPPYNYTRAVHIVSCLAWMVKHGDITLDEAVQAIASFEPPEPTEACAVSTPCPIHGFETV